MLCDLAYPVPRVHGPVQYSMFLAVVNRLAHFPLVRLTKGGHFASAERAPHSMSTKASIRFKDRILIQPNSLRPSRLIGVSL